MSRIITPRRDLILPSKRLQRGSMILDAYRFGGGGGSSWPSGVLCAFDVKVLKPGFSGNVLRIRRSSDNAELNIGVTGGAVDSAAATAFAGAGDGFVVTMYDQNGSGTTLTTTANNQQPKVINAGTWLGEARFNGTTNVMTSSAVISPASTAATLFARLRRDGTSGSLVEPIFTIGSGGYNTVTGGICFAYDARYGTATPNFWLAAQQTGGSSSVNIQAFSLALSSMGTVTLIEDTSLSATDQARVWIAGVSATRINASFNYDNYETTVSLASSNLLVGAAGGYFAKISLRGLIVCGGDQSADRVSAEALFS